MLFFEHPNWFRINTYSSHKPRVFKFLGNYICLSDGTYHTGRGNTPADAFYNFKELNK